MPACCWRRSTPLSPQIGGNFILAAFAVVVLGGLGSVWGAFIGGFVVGLIEAFAGFYLDPALKHAVWFIIFIVMLIVRPAGLFGHRRGRGDGSP